MFYPGSGSQKFSSWILLYIKRGMKNKCNLFLAPNGFQKHTLWILDPRSGIRKKFIPDPGGKKAPNPGSTTLGWIFK
jgi:hypothetical protein